MDARGQAPLKQHWRTKGDVCDHRIRPSVKRLTRAPVRERVHSYKAAVQRIRQHPNSLSSSPNEWKDGHLRPQTQQSLPRSPRFAWPFRLPRPPSLFIHCARRNLFRTPRRSSALLGQLFDVLVLPFAFRTLHAAWWHPGLLTTTEPRMSNPRLCVASRSRCLLICFPTQEVEDGYGVGCLCRCFWSYQHFFLFAGLQILAPDVAFRTVIRGLPLFHKSHIFPRW